MLNKRDDDLIKLTLKNLPINYEKHSVLGCFVPEGDIVWNHNGCVESEYKYYPIPNGFESTIVQQYMRWSLWSFLSILR